MIGRGRSRVRGAGAWTSYAGAVARLPLALVLVLVVAGCSTDSPPDDQAGPPPSSSVRTLEPLRITKPPATGELFAEVKQSSRDAALGRIQVWITNDRETDLLPTTVTYHDDRFLRPLQGGRLRLIPARSFRGYTLQHPRRPDCRATADSGSGTVVVEHDGERETVAVGDEADVVQRFQSTTCFELTVARVASLSWSDEVPVDRPGADSVGELQLQIRPRGAGSLTLERVTGTPLLTAARPGEWELDLTVQGSDGPSTLPLPMRPSRCDDHVFLEAAGATAFRLALTVDPPGPGEPVSGELILRMAPAGAAHAIQFARDSCGY